MLPLVAGCGARGPDLPPAGTVGRATLLAPLSGPRAPLGQIMLAAASLGGDTAGAAAEVEVRDAGETAESAVAAARAAVDAGARMLLGPLFSGQSRAVADAVGRVPVVSLSNDDALAGGNLFVFGITPLQSARAVLGLAAVRGVRRIAVVVPPGEFGARHVAAAQAVAPELGLALGTPVVTGGAEGLADAVAADGTRPDGIYLPVVSEEFEAQAAALAATGAQVLGSDQWSLIDPALVPRLRGAWYAAPDPLSLEGFFLAIEQQVEADAGVVAALAFDASELARLLGRLDQQDRDGLQREAGYEGVLGPYRFLSSGVCERRLAVLGVVEGGTAQIASA